MSAYDDLTEKQRRFVEAYLTHGNASEAYRAAGYQARSGWNAHAARMIARDSVKAALAERRAQLADPLKITPERVLTEWARIAFFTLPQVGTWGPGGLTLADSATLSADAAAALASVEMIPTEAGPRLKITTHSKTAALKALSEHLDLFGTREALDHLGQGLMGLMAQARREHTNGHKAAAS